MARRRAEGSPRFWRALATCAPHAGVRAEWEEWLGEEMALAEPFLRPDSALADSYPCPRPGEDQCPRRIVASGRRFRAVCANLPAECDELTLGRRDVVIHRIDIRKIARRVAEILGIDDATCKPVGGFDALRELGTIPVLSTRIAAFLGVVACDDESGLNDLLARVPAGPFVLLLPQGASSDFRQRAEARRCAVLPCASSFVLAPGGGLDVRRDFPKWLDAHRKVLGVERAKAKPAARRGPRARYSSKDDKRLIEDWKASGDDQAEFERKRGREHDAVRKALDRIRSAQRRRRQGPSTSQD